MHESSGVECCTSSWSHLASAVAGGRVPCSGPPPVVTEPAGASPHSGAARWWPCSPCIVLVHAVLRAAPRLRNRGWVDGHAHCRLHRHHPVRQHRVTSGGAGVDGGGPNLELLRDREAIVLELLVADALHREQGLDVEIELEDAASTSAALSSSRVWARCKSRFWVRARSMARSSVISEACASVTPRASASSDQR